MHRAITTVIGALSFRAWNLMFVRKRYLEMIILAFLFLALNETRLTI